MVILGCGSNTAHITFNNGTELLFHHDTPVAGYIPEGYEDFYVYGMKAGYFKSETRHSVTTSQRVAKYLKESRADPKSVNVFPQEKVEDFASYI